MPPSKTDTPPVIPQQLDQTATPSSWRDDLSEVGIVSAVLLVGGLLAGIVLTGAGVLSHAIHFGIYLVTLFALCWLPFLLLATMKARSVTERHRLAWTRSQSERRILESLSLDLDGDGDTSETELLAFLRWVRHVYHGGKTTSGEAQRLGISGPVWTRYRNALIALGLALPIGKRGGLGFELRPETFKQPWPKVERRIRDALLTHVSLDIIDAPQHSMRNVPGKLAIGGGGGREEVETYTRTQTPTQAGKRAQMRERLPVSTLPPDVAIGDPEE